SLVSSCNCSKLGRWTTSPKTRLKTMGRAGISGCGRPSVKPAASRGNWKRFWAYCTNRLKRLASALCIGEAFVAAQEFGVDLGKFLHPLLEASEMGDAFFG